MVISKMATKKTTNKASKTSKTKKGVAIFNGVSDTFRRISLIISGVIAIFGVFTGIVSWVNAQVQDAITTEISELRSEIKTNHEQTDRKITRLELLNLIHNQPTNVTEIEKVARYYFQTLKGDWYVTGIYSRWCAEYGGNTSIAAGVE